MINNGLLTRQTVIVDELNRPLDRVHLAWENGGGTTTNSFGKASVIAPANANIRISFVGKETDYFNLKSLPAKIMMINKMESLDEVTITAKKKQKTPSYIVPAIGAGLLLIALMSFGEETKEITL